MARKKIEATETIAAWKGFDKNLVCNPSGKTFQYEIGKTYEHNGDVVACGSGFHVCENPMDVLGYYPLIANDGSPNRFCKVTVGGKIERHTGDSKIAAAQITVEAELQLPEFIKTAVNWIIDQVGKGDGVQAASGDYSQLAASGDSSQLAASGDSSQLAASGYYSKLAASGYYSKLEVTGTKSAAAAVGPGSTIKATAGTPIAICEYASDGTPIGFATGVAGHHGVPADVWLKASGGKLVEA